MCYKRWRKLSGILTDGDKKIITKIQKPLPVNDDVSDYTIKKPITISPDQNINDGIKIWKKILFEYSSSRWKFFTWLLHFTGL